MDKDNKQRIKSFLEQLMNNFTWKYYLLALVGILLACSQSLFINFLDNYIVNCLDFDYGFVSRILSVGFLFWCSYKLYVNWKIKHNYSDMLVAFLLFLGITILFFRIKIDYYLYEDFIGHFKYVDLLCIVSLCFVAEGFINRLRLHENEDPQNAEIISDTAIYNPSMDKLNYYREALNIVEKIKSLPFSRSTSIAILSPWGYGKTSFINLIQYALEHGAPGSKPLVDCEIIKFNPRQSRNVGAIQEDFFSSLVESLKKYDSTLSSKVNQYISTIGLCISNPITSFFSSFLNKNNEDLKKGISNMLRKIDKRVIVFIDDLDRLTGEEIIEVLKLIDKNAAFSNIVFITAFDQEFVNNSLTKYTGGTDSPFIDKFFSIRFHLPIRSSYNVLDQLYFMLRDSIQESNDLLDIMRNNNSIFISYIKNIREAKNFCNQFVADYTPEIANQVYLHDFLLLELIKFKYYDEYYRLSQHEYVTEKGELFVSRGYYILKEQYQNSSTNNSMPKSIDIMRKLFHIVEDGKGFHYQSVQMIRFFDIYFTTNIVGRIPVPELNALFTLNSDNNILSKFKEWKNSNCLEDVRDYLRFFKWDNVSEVEGLSKKDTFKQYLRILFLYSAFIDNKDSYINIIQFQLLHKPNFEKGYNGMTEEEYHICVLDIIYNENHIFCPSSFLMELTRMFMVKSEEKHEEMVNNCIIKEEDIRSNNLSLFKNYLNQSTSVEYSDYTQRLYQLCIDHISDNMHYHIPEANSLMYDFLLNDKSYAYLKPFYRKNENDYSIQFSIHPFCKEIFGIEVKGEDKFLEYVDSSDIDETEKLRISLYWNRYKEAGTHNFGYYLKSKASPKPSEEDIINGLIFN